MIVEKFKGQQQVVITEENSAMLIVNAEEFEYICMGLHRLIERNAENAKEHAGQEIEGPTGITANVVDEIFAPQHVDISKLLDQMVGAWGYDPAVEG